MKKSLSRGLILALLGSTSALAADLPRRSTATYNDPVYSQNSVVQWTGFYAGATLGYALGSYRDSGIFGDANGGLIGLTGGYNYQSGNLLVGLEGDLSATSISANGGSGGVAAKVKSPTFVTVRGRLGYAIDRILFYGTVGYAGETVNATLFNPNTPAFYTTEGFHHGYVLGFGAEYAFNASLSAKAEFLYATMGSSSAFGGVNATKIGVHENVLRTGLNYHF